MITGSEERALIVQACRVLEANGHADYIWGHVSLRDRAGRGFWMKPAGLGFEEVGEDDVILVDFDGQVVEGTRPRHSEWPIHSQILLGDPASDSVVHTHPPYAIALGASGLPLKAVSHAGALFVPPDVPRFDLTANLITTPALGDELARTLAGQPAALMVNHGIVTAGSSIQEAVVRAVLLEKACHHQLLAVGAGRELLAPSDEESVAKRATAWPPHHLQALWDYLVRSLASSDHP
jgi:L-fuculose-phosphate aldolase